MYVEFDILNDSSRVWIYPADRQLTEAEVSHLSSQCKSFVEQWTAHNLELKASFNLLHNQILVLSVDENVQGASGCSIDSSVRFVQALEVELGVKFMNGGKVAVDTGNGISLLSTKEVKQMSEESVIDADTRMYDHLVKDIGELKQRFETRVGDSWLSRFLLKKQEA